ncbi:MAG: Clp protease N-terminal domain-containing protein [Phycisphaerae bacterium]
MLEKFSRHAKLVFTIANQEAQRYGHDHIAPEHILLGLVKEGSGVGSHALTDLGIDAREVRKAVLDFVGKGADGSPPDVLHQTPEAKAVVERAVVEARSHHEHVVGTEHILLALMHNPEGIPAKVLTKLGVSFERVRREIHDVFDAGDDEGGP